MEILGDKMRNLASLVAWHDSGWNGRVCKNPKENKYCESFGYVRWRKNTFCRNNANINLGNLKNRACSEAVMFCNGEVIDDGGRAPGIFFTNNDKIKREIKEQLNMVNGKYSIIYVRENPLSESRVIIGCVRIRDILKLNNSKKSMMGFDVDFDVKNDIIFALPYQELLEYCKNNSVNIPDDLIFEVGEFERYFKGMSNFISDEVVIQILKKGLDILEKFSKFMEENPDFNKYLTDENIAFRLHVMKKFDEFVENIRKVIVELEGSKYKYPGLPGVLYFLGMENAYSKYIEIWKNEGENGEENLYNAFLECLENKRGNLDFGITEKVINKFMAQREEFKEFLKNYAVYYEFSGYKLGKINEQYEKGFVNLEELIKNPYVLVEDLKEGNGVERIIFEELDSWEKRRLNKNFNEYNPYRVRALLVEILKRHLSLGNTVISTKDLKDFFETMDENILKITFDEFLGIIKNYNNIISEKVEIVKKEIKNNNNKEIIELYILKEIRNYEKIIEDTINHLLKSELPNIDLNPLEIREKLREGNKKPKGVSNEEYENALDIQVEAVINLLKNRVGILTGPAGTGKTTVIKTIVRLMKEKENLRNILILTPTGKSAMVVKEKLDRLADIKTIHRFISKEFRSYFDFDYYILKLNEISNNEKKKVDAIIIDESSMVDIKTMGWLLGTINLDNLKYLIFVGDINQLPPVDAGKPFYDIYKHLERVNSQSICKLDTVLRADSKKVVDLSKLFLNDINDEEKTKILDEMLKIKRNLGSHEIYMIKDNANDMEKEIITIDVVKDGNIRKSLEDAIENILKENNKEDFFKFAVFNDNLQILTPTKTKGEFGSYIINLFIKQESKFIPNEYKNKMLWKWFFGDGKVADKVIQVKNNYNKWIYNTNRRQWGKNGVFNGMVGYTYTSKEWNKYKSKYETKTIVKFYYPGIEAYTDEQEMEHAYAITIHKSQGSGFENVILIIPRGLNKFVSKEMLYTAITRSKKRLYIIVEEDIKNFLDANISELSRRKTNLFGNFNTSYLIPYLENRQIITINGENVRSWQECVLANLFHEVGIEYIYEPLSEYSKIGVLPDFKLNAMNKTILWEHYGMVDNESYLARQKEKEEIYKNAGFQILKISEITDNIKLGEKVLITSTSEDLRNNNKLIEKLKLLNSFGKD